MTWGQDGTIGIDQRSNRGHYVVAQHEARVARVGVEDSDDSRHVNTTNSYGQGDAYHSGQGGAQHGQAHAQAGLNQEVASWLQHWQQENQHRGGDGQTA